MEQLLSEALAELDFESTTVENVLSCGGVRYPVNGPCAKLTYMYQEHMARNQSDQIGYRLALRACAALAPTRGG